MAAYIIALRERLERQHARRQPTMKTRLHRLAAEVAAIPVADPRRPDEIIDYDGVGLPR